MLINHFSQVHSKKLGFLASLTITRFSHSYLVSVWSSRGLFGSHSFTSHSQALSFCQFLGVSKKNINKSKQLNFFNN